MFDVKSAFKALEGTKYSGGDFWDRIVRMRIDNMEDIPAEADVNDLIVFARRRQWLEEDESGNILVKVP